MFRSVILFAALLLNNTWLYAQDDKRADIWYFGYNAGIDFSGKTPVGLNGGMMAQREGCASIADVNGKLMMYTDGTTIWNKNHKVISPGTELGGSDTSTQSALIIPKPGSPDIYFVFTSFNNLVCITVDMKLDKGNGIVISRTVLMKNATEKLAAVRHCNQRDFWILAHENGNRVFRSFLLSDAGVSKSSVVSKIGTPLNFYKSVGHMKFSPQGDRLAMAVYGKGQFQLFKFDNFRGTLSDELTLKHQDFLSAYGLEFSPGGNYLYVCETVNFGSSLFQLDVSSLDTKKIMASKTEIGKPPLSYFGALQLGPDNKIYVAIHGQKHLGIIKEPNLKGLRCAYDNEGFQLPYGTSGMGLPNFAVMAPVIKPVISINSTASCNEVTLTAETNARATNMRLQWYQDNTEIPGAKAKTYMPVRSGKYHVVLSDPCFNTPVRSEAADVKLLELVARWLPLECGLLQLSAQANADVFWSGDGIHAENERLKNVRVSGSGRSAYVVRAVDEHDPSCYVEKRLNVDFGICDASLFIPDIFTPNGDQINDLFEVIIADGKGIQLTIYDRWGEVVHQTRNNKMVWDGKMNGMDALSGAYTFIMQYANNRGQEFTRRGTVILQR